MAVKTSLQVKTFNPVTNKNVTKTATYSNPNATDAQLNSFAQNFYGGLSDNTVNSVIRVDKQSITNAESDTQPTGTYALWTPSAKFYDINNADFLNALVHSYTSPPQSDSIAAINSITAATKGLSIKATRESGITDTYLINKLFIFAKGYIKVLVTYREHSTFQTIGTEGFYIPTLAENLGITTQDMADMIMQNKTVQLLAQGLILANESLDSKYEKHANISYVPATNSIRVDPIEGFEDDFALRLANPAPMVVYDAEEYYLPDPTYTDGQSLGLNTKVTLDEDSDIYIDMGIMEDS